MWNSRQSWPAKSRSRSMRMASRVGLKIGRLLRSNSLAQGACAQSMDIGTTTSTASLFNKGTGEGNCSRRNVRPASEGG